MVTNKRKRNKEFPHVGNASGGESKEDQHRETQSMSFRLMDLPSSIIIEILKKMGTGEVFQCRCACKTLCRLISDPSFANHFLVRSPFFSLVYRSTSRKIILFVRIEGDEIRPCKTLDHVSMRQIPKEDDLELVGSSKGLLCLRNKSSNANNLYITNPLLGESAILPKPLGDKCATIDETYWFGYVPPMGVFKVIRVKVTRALLQSNPRKYHNKSEVHVFAIGSDTWKYGGDAPFPHRGKFCKTILNGCLHWIVGDDKDTLQLHSFNMEENRSHSLPPPPMLGNLFSFVDLGVVGKHLGLIGCSSDRQLVEIWSMKDYGIPSSWARYFVIRIFDDSFLGKALTFWKDEELKFLWYYGVLLSYDPKGETYTGCSNMGSTREDDVWIYTPSFLSLTYLCLGSRLRVKYTKSYLP